MKIICPHCGKEVTVCRLGRKPLNLNVNNVLDSLQTCGSITLTAKEYGVSRGSIYNIIKACSKDKQNDVTIQNN